MEGTQTPLSGTETMLIGLVVSIVVIPSATWGLVQAHVPAWWLMPLAVLYATVRSLHRAIVLER